MTVKYPEGLGKWKLIRHDWGRYRNQLCLWHGYKRHGSFSWGNSGDLYCAYPETLAEVDVQAAVDDILAQIEEAAVSKVRVEEENRRYTAVLGIPVSGRDR